MKLIKASFNIIKQEPDINGIYRIIERAGRISYKSEDKITEDSAKKFVDRMIRAGHGACLEHGTIYLKIELNSSPSSMWKEIIEFYEKNPYSKIVNGTPYDQDHTYYNHVYYITTNYRVLVENNKLNDLRYLCEPTKFHEKRISVRFILSRSIAQEYTRHRVFSFLMESQRYCNYSRDKFGNEVTFIQPCWDYKKIATYNGVDHFDGDYFEHSLREAESYYFRLLDLGWKPQQAREVLPNATKTELIMTGFVSDWEHFFELRTPVNAHPQARELAIPLMEEFIKRKYI